MTDKKVILIDDDRDILRSMEQTLRLDGYQIRSFQWPEPALEALGRCFDGIVISDIKMPNMDGIEVLRAVKEIDPEIPVIMLTGHADVPLAVEALHSGAHEFIEKPFDPQFLLDTANRAVAFRTLALENRDLRSRLSRSDSLEEVLVGRSKPMCHLRRLLTAFAEADADVLLTGESGTGRKLSARAIHDRSGRRDLPFVSVNLNVLPAHLLEFELYGHAKDVPSQPQRERFGRLESARGGTVLLEDIDRTPLALQAHFLRAIESRMITPVGSNTSVKLNVRFIATASSDLKRKVAQGVVRDDLYYKLSVLQAELPSVSQRLEDVPALFSHLAREASLKYKRDVPPIRKETIDLLLGRTWEGNVTEIRNVADRFVLGVDLDHQFRGCGTQVGLSARLDHFEKSILLSELMLHGGDLQAVYESLGISRKTLYLKLRKHGIDKHEYLDTNS